MQEPRRPSPTGGQDRDKLPYDPIEWNRRLEQAREARAKVLAAREAGKAEPADEPAMPLSEPAPEAPTALPRPEITGAPSQKHVTWRMVLGFVIGIAVGMIALSFAIRLVSGA